MMDEVSVFDQTDNPHSIAMISLRTPPPPGLLIALNYLYVVVWYVLDIYPDDDDDDWCFTATFVHIVG